jgi:hypothetical protein
MSYYQIHGLSKREPRATALPIHERYHELSGEHPNKNKADRDKRGQRNTNPKPATGFSLTVPRHKRHNEHKSRNQDHRDDYERNYQ